MLRWGANFHRGLRAYGGQERVLIAAGAVVTKDVQDYALMAGVPARHRLGM